MFLYDVLGSPSNMEEEFSLIRCLELG